MKRLKVAGESKEAKKKSILERLFDGEKISKDEAGSYRGFLKTLTDLEKEGMFNFPEIWIKNNILPPKVVEAFKVILRFRDKGIWPWALTVNQIEEDEPVIIL
jgi:hypothetical protein